MKKEITLHNQEEIAKFLFDKMKDISAELYTYYLIELKGSDEDKKTVQASMFLTGLMTGEFIKEDNAELYERYGSKFEALWEYIDDYNTVMSI